MPSDITLNNHQPHAEKPLPWWTWIAPLAIIEAGDQISLLFFQDNITSSFYLPTSLGLILVFWWGPLRVFPSLFIVTTLNNYFYGFSSYWIWFGFGLGDSCSIALSWFLFNILLKGKAWMPDTRNLVLFLVFGLAIPITCYAVNWQFMYVLNHNFGWAQFLPHLRRDLLGETIVNIIIVIPTLVFLTPLLSRIGLIPIPPIPVSAFTYLTRKKHTLEVALISAVVLALAFLFDFQDVWFLFGSISLYVAIRFGFDAVLVANVIIFSATYLVPTINHPEFVNAIIEGGNAPIFFGYLLLFLFAAVTGRVISDLRIIERELNAKNKELQQTNVELDRFVYSASHDMSAPLKSIRGLVNVGLLTKPTAEQEDYWRKIEKSARKLEDFIDEVLHYSRNNRTELVLEELNIKQLCEEIFSHLRYFNEGNAPGIVFDHSANRTIIADRSRLKIILNNLLSNAIKYQKKDSSHHPLISISLREDEDRVTIRIDDNGEGIPIEIQPSVFKMFYRGNLKSTGSGLGLYIALEAANKMGGKITFQSEYGKGSTFMVELPNQ